MYEIKYVEKYCFGLISETSDNNTNKNSQKMCNYLFS